jgi:ABC-type transporter Mla maintaining outer membrane lipid asymmetry ATPase subunit MlaF
MSGMATAPAGDKERWMAPSVIDVSQLRKTYGRLVAVDDVSFSVRAEEIFGILGPNGAGARLRQVLSPPPGER